MKSIPLVCLLFGLLFHASAFAEDITITFDATAKGAGESEEPRKNPLAEEEECIQFALEMEERAALDEAALASPILPEKPEHPPTPEQIDAWIAQLEHDNFEVRQRTINALDTAREAALPAFEKALMNNPIPEVVKSINLLKVLCDAGGEVQNGLSVKLSLNKTELGDRDSFQARLLFINHTEVPMVISVRETGYDQSHIQLEENGRGLNLLLGSDNPYSGIHPMGCNSLFDVLPGRSTVEYIYFYRVCLMNHPPTFEKLEKEKELAHKARYFRTWNATPGTHPLRMLVQTLPIPLKGFHKEQGYRDVGDKWFTSNEKCWRGRIHSNEIKVQVGQP